MEIFNKIQGWVLSSSLKVKLRENTPVQYNSRGGHATIRDFTQGSNVFYPLFFLRLRLPRATKSLRKRYKLCHVVQRSCFGDYDHDIRANLA